MWEKIKSLGLGVGAIILLGVLAQWLFPWWIIAVVALYVGYFVHESPSKSFAYGTVAVTLMWLTYAGIQSSMNGGLMSTSISGMTGGKLCAVQLLGFTGILGGLVGGFAAMTGTMLRQLIKAS